jgi:FkbM family methyltransferase
MGVEAVFRKIPILVRLIQKKQIKVGDTQYRTRGFFANELALRASVLNSEPSLDDVYRTALTSKKGVFLDVGANIGQTMLKMLALERTRPYVGFEPQVPCCFLLQRFIEENDLNSHIALPLGLSNRNEVVKLRTRREEDYDSAASMIENFRPASFYTSHRYVSVRKGDDVVSDLKISEISTIKIDVEGGELEVIEGLSKTIQEQKPFIIFEVLNFYLVLTGRKLDEECIRFRQSRNDRIQAMLTAHGYDIYQVITRSRLKKIDRIEPRHSADLEMTNYVAIPKVKSDAFFGNFAGAVQEDDSRAA